MVNWSVLAMSCTETPILAALSRSILIVNSGFVNFRFKSDAENTELLFTSSMKTGNIAFKSSRFFAWITYSTGSPPRRPPKVCCWETKVRPPVNSRTCIANSSAISCWVRFRLSASTNHNCKLARFVCPPPMNSITFSCSGTVCSTKLEISSA